MSSFRARDLFFVAILKPNLNNIFHQEMFVKNWFQDELGVKPSDLIAMARKFCNEPNNKKIDEYTGVYIYYYIDGFLFNKDRRKIYVNNEIEIPQIINIDVFESLSSERMKERIDGLRSYYMNFIGFRQSPPIYKLGNYWDTAHSEDLDGFKYSITIENIAASYAKRSRELAK
nr:hypothetical protein [uncultured Cohaesibacter sp.]